MSSSQEIESTADTAETPGAGGRSILFVIAIAALVLMLPSPEHMNPQSHRLVAVTVLMAGFWVTHAIPLAATSLLPLCLFPLMGIMSAEDVSKAFVNDILFLYLGGMVLAMGIERWQLHRRIALNLVNLIGVSPRRLVLGFLITTAALSMWISNTACTLLMLPIAMAMLKTLDDGDADLQPESSGGRRSDRLAVPLLLSIAYAASLGGMTTLVGTPTNQAAIGTFHKERPDLPQPTVAEWLMICGPIGAVYLGITWLVLTRGLPARSDSDAVLRLAMRARLTALGRMTTAERRMLIVFVLTAALWIFREPLELFGIIRLPGWRPMYLACFDYVTSLTGSQATFPAGNVISDSTIAIVMAVILFLLPSGIVDESGRSLALMNWSTANKLPWDMILLFGGGFALAEGFRDTGLSAWLGDALQQPLRQLPPWLVIAVLCGAMTFLTEFTSNVATVNTLMPTFLAVAAALKMDPRVIFIPATLAASCAFMMPVGTPPNAIIFGSGRITVRQMASYGLVLNLIGIPLLTAGALLLIQPAVSSSPASGIRFELNPEYRHGSIASRSTAH